MSVLRGSFTVGKRLGIVGLGMTIAALPLILVGCNPVAARLSLGGLVVSTVGFVLDITMFLLAQLFRDDWWLE